MEKTKLEERLGEMLDTMETSELVGKIRDSSLVEWLNRESTKEYLKGSAQAASGIAKALFSGNGHSYGIKCSGRRAEEHFRRARELKEQGL